MKTKYLLVGRSGSGKDTMANYLCNELGLKQLLSYTTRPQRYTNENTHIFITADESKLIQSTEDIIAYTKIGEYEYFGTYNQLIESDIYIIDPNGIKYLKDNYEQKLLDEDVELVTIYTYTDDDLRATRAMLRCDDIRIYNQRCIDENEQFNRIEDSMDYDFEVCNNDGYEAETDIKWIVDLCNKYN